MDGDRVVSESCYLLGIDDTDTIDSEYGTGRVSRMLGDHVADEFADATFRGSVRQQLLVDPRVPYTTHNSAACLVFELGEGIDPDDVVDVAAEFLEGIAADGSDPGLCAGPVGSVDESVVAFGDRASEELVTEFRATELAAASGLFLDEYGGTGEGIIGALAAVGRTATGDRGRFVGYGRIREYGEPVGVDRLLRDGISVVTAEGSEVERGQVRSGGWVRPQLRNDRPTLEVERIGEGTFRPTNVTE